MILMRNEEEKASHIIPLFLLTRTLRSKAMAAPKAMAEKNKYVLILDIINRLIFGFQIIEKVLGVHLLT